MTQLDEYAETTIAQRLSMVEGVAQVTVWGSAKYAVRVQLDPQQLAARGIGVSQVANAIRQNNVMLPTGVLYGPNQTLTVQATGQLVRPVTMTALAAILGLLPAAFSTAIGSQSQRPLAVVVVGGMLATLLLMNLVPVLYSLYGSRTPPEGAGGVGH